MTKATRRANAQPASKAEPDALAISPAVGTATAPIDPVFAAIERHRVTWQRVMDVGEPDDDPPAYEPWDELIYKETKDAFRAAEEALLTTAPTTIGGARAIIEHLIDEDERCDTELSKTYLPTLLKSPLLA